MEASRLANYWRRYFHLAEVPYTSHQTEPHQQHEHYDWPDAPTGNSPVEDDGDDTSVLGNPPEPTDQGTSVPHQISQLAHILYDTLLQDPDFNAPILELLRIPSQDPTESNLRLFTSAELSQLSSHLAVTANFMARTANPEDFPADFSEDDDAHSGL